MTAAIIGGAIAAVIGAVFYFVAGLWQERRHEKARRLTIVDSLSVETLENLVICKSPEIRTIWWTASYKLEAYRAYKGELLFLSEDVIGHLIAAAFMMEGHNVGIQTYLSRIGSGENVGGQPLPLPQELIEHLEFVDQELRKWAEKHTGFLGNFRR